MANLNNVTVIFGTARSGSNFFLSACKRFDRLTTLGEMYHRHAVYPLGLDVAEDFQIKARLLQCLVYKYPAQIGLQPQDLAGFAEFSGTANARLDEILVKFSHTHFKLFFSEIAALGSQPHIIFKIFPEHLGLWQILHLVTAFRPRIILMMRNPLDSFISGLKAAVTKKYGTEDTTELKVEFKREAYFAYKSAMLGYFSGIAELCAEIGLDYTILRYEDIHAANVADPVEYIRQRLSAAVGEELPYARQERQMPLFTKQDRAGSTAEKVANPQDVPKGDQNLAIPPSPLKAGARILAAE